MPTSGDSIWVKQSDGSWRSAVWQEAKGEADPATGSDLIFVTYEDSGLGDAIPSQHIALRTDDEPPGL